MNNRTLEEYQILAENIVHSTVSEDNYKSIHQKLYELIPFFEKQYYVHHRHVISDYTYDRLFEILKKIETAYPELQQDYSPLLRVGNDSIDTFNTVKHAVPMLSLENSYNENDLLDFDTSVKKLSQENEIMYCVEPKFDGASIALTYENNVLIRAVTRGNGTEGDEVTHNARVIKSIPLFAPFSTLGITKIELRGEVMISQPNFNAMNKERESKNLPIYQNARNTVSGSLRTKDNNEAKNRRMEAFMYQIAFAQDNHGNDMLASNSFASHFNNIEMLSTLGFKTPIAEKKRCNSIAEVLNFIQEWEIKRDNYNYEIDGMVVKADSLKVQRLLGFTSHHPRWAVAFKFKPKKALTQLLAVEYQVGRTGAVTPVAKLQPVRLAGVTVSSVSLHNSDFIKERNIELGDYVYVERAGDVIPYISDIDISKRENTAPILFPSHCPVCGSPLEKPENEAVWRCYNTANCSAQIEEGMIHFVSKDAMNIDGLGREIIIDFVQRGFIKNISDIYNLPYNEIEKLDGWKEKSINNLKQGIEKSKTNELWRLITGLGIRLVGVNTAKMLSKQVESIFDFTTWDAEKYTSLPDVGPKVANSLFQFFSDTKHIELLHSLALSGVVMHNTPNDTNTNEGILQGKTILFTGTLSSLKRDEAEQIAEKNGAKIASSVSKNLSILVVGENAGSKLEKARQLGNVTIWTEAEFITNLSL